MSRPSQRSKASASGIRAIREIRGRNSGATASQPARATESAPEEKPRMTRITRMQKGKTSEPPRAPTSEPDSAELPPGWTQLKVGDYFSSCSGGTPARGEKAYWHGKIPWFSSGDIKAATVTESSESITPSGLENSSAKMCRKGSVLVVVRSGILKHTLPVALLGADASINQDIKCFDSGNDELNRWLALAWRASAQELLGENREGTTVQSVKYETLRDFVLPVPPLPEQRRIVAKLEELLGKVEASRQRLAKVPALLKRFRQSVLAAACSGRLTADWREADPASSASVPSAKSAVKNPNPKIGETADDADNADGLAQTGRSVSAPSAPPRAANSGEAELSDRGSRGGAENAEDLPEGWRSVRLGELSALVTSGSRGWAEYYANEGATFIRAQNISGDVLDLSDVAFVKLPSKAEGSRTRVKQNDILVTITGANVTKSALVDVSMEEAYVSQHVALVRLSDTRLARYVMCATLSIAHGRKQLLDAAYGQGKPGLNLDNVRSVEIPLPPLPEQEEIVRRVEALFAVADRLEARFEKARAQVDRLAPALLAKAFRGELVPQDPRDEPAAALLERLREAQ